MQGGDLGTWEQPSLIVVLEGVLCSPSWKGRLTHRLVEPEQWGWSVTSLRAIHRYTYGSVPVEVVTFLGTEVADHAAAWMSRYDIEVAGVEAMDLDHFARSLAWRHNQVDRVIDSEADRLARFGQKGYQTVHGGEF